MAEVLDQLANLSPERRRLVERLLAKQGVRSRSSSFCRVRARATAFLFHRLSGGCGFSTSCGLGPPSTTSR